MIINILIILAIALGGFLGFKRGAARGLVNLISLIAISIVSFQLKDFLGNLFIKFLPFFNYGGKFNGMFSLNILIYQGIAFLIVFTLLYCVLNILVNLSNFMEIVDKFNPCIEKFSKPLGAAFGAIESCIVVFLVAFCLLQFGHSQGIVMNNNMLKGIVEKTPIVNVIFAKSIVAGESIYLSMENPSPDELENNLEIVRTLIKFSVVKAPLVQQSIDSGKLNMENVVVASQG